jgi:L-seryl-tRNA(Ser) seleniumtransferase
MTHDAVSIYEELGVSEAVNAAGTKTRIGGTRIRPEAVEAMRRAAGSFARISDLQARASETIADATGAEAGYVASGAAACLTLAAAACMTRHDFAAMSQLPHTAGLADEILVPTVHRNSYDHALRASGATLVNIGNNDRTLGPVACDLEPWEIEAAITDRTAAVAYVARNDLPLEPLVAVAHDNDLPVIVDGAGRLPPKENLTRFVEAGADLVVFSGGKGIRGPQSTGIIAGRRDLVSAVALQHLDMDAMSETWDPPASLIDRSGLVGVPRHGVGRGFKVGKEELVGLIRALELYLDEDETARFEEWDRRARYVARTLENVDILETAIAHGDEPQAVTKVVVTVDESRTRCTTAELVLSLRRDTPRVFVDDREVAESRFAINPMCLTDEETDLVVDRVIESLSEDG